MQPLTTAGTSKAGGRTARWLPVELDVVHLARLVDQGESVHSKALHVTVVGRHTHVIHEEGEHVHALRVVGKEVCNAPALLDVILGIGLQGMYHVGELHSITHEEDWKVVSDQIPIS